MSHIYPISSNVTLTNVADPNKPQRAGLVVGYGAPGVYNVARLADGNRKHEQLHEFEPNTLIDDGSPFLTGQNPWRITACSSTSDVATHINGITSELEQLRTALAKSEEDRADELATVQKRLTDAMFTMISGSVEATDRLTRSLKGEGIIQKPVAAPKVKAAS